MNDRNVELIQRWQPGGARNGTCWFMNEDASYLMAVNEAGDEWEFFRTGIEFTAHGMRFTADTEWEWNDVEWFIPCDDVDLPRL